MRLGRPFAALLLLVSAGACSFMVDASDIDQGCGDNEKICDGKCVLIEDPAYGCQIDGCTSCAFAHAIPMCLDNECAVKTCLEGYCGGDCSTNMLMSEQNCGGCGQSCLKDQICENGTCVPR